MKDAIDNQAPAGKITNFPTDTLSSSLDFVKRIISERGEQFSTVKQIIIATGIPEGSLSLPLSTAVQYGLLENVYGKGYRPTPRYNRIQAPTFEHDKDCAIYEALNSPPLYAAILSEFNGRVLPNTTGFSNYLTQKFQFKQYAIPKIVKAFFLNFGVSIDANNKLRFAEPVNKDGKMETLIQDVEPIAEQKRLPAPVREREGNFQAPIVLSPDKMIVLEYPKGNMTAEDFTVLKAYIAYLELSEKVKENE